MDPRQHARFLDYLEAFSYFQRPGLVKLDRDAWTALDAELAALMPRQKTWTAAERLRVKELRAQLFRD